MPNTIRLHRVIAAKPEKVFRAFVEADAIASWLPPYGFVCTVHELDARAGGKHRMSFRKPLRRTQRVQPSNPPMRQYLRSKKPPKLPSTSKLKESFRISREVHV